MSPLYPNLVGEPKPDRIRIIANKIEENPFNFSQSTLGPALSSRGYIGSGVQAGTSSCVAGFAVQFFGTVEEYEGIRRDYANSKIYLFRDSLGVCDVERYASLLLGLPSEWANSIYTSMWPRAWLENLEYFAPLPTIDEYKKAIVLSKGGPPCTFNPLKVPTVRSGEELLTHNKLSDGINLLPINNWPIPINEYHTGGDM